MFDWRIDVTEPLSKLKRACLFLAAGMIALYYLFWSLYNEPEIPLWLRSVGIGLIVSLVAKRSSQGYKLIFFLGYLWLIACFVYSLLYFHGFFGAQLGDLTHNIEKFLLREGYLQDFVEMGMSSSTELQAYIIRTFQYAHIGGIVWCGLWLFAPFLRATQEVLPLLFIANLLVLPVVCFVASIFA